MLCWALHRQQCCLQLWICCCSAGKESVAQALVEEGPTGRGCLRRLLTFSAAAFLTKTITLDEIRLKFEIWDTAGQERYHSLAPMYYRDAAGSLVVYDINDKESFEKAKRWLNELYKAGSSNMVIVLVGNKHDLPEREVEEEEGRKFAEEHGLTFFETSAKTSHNVDEVFDVLGRNLLEKNPPEEDKDEDDLITIGSKPYGQHDKGCPC
mmetsp:Transcript_16802/g.65629  ORF Transcript_16802/g.65629 Transcript_16802/m.65629 type:complete len:209 (+) Transcript_16802:262-888(+)